MPETLSDDLVGQTVDGRYKVQRLVAHGGMASVFVATDTRLGRDVALKIMSPALSGSESGGEFTKRFRREARAAARLTHPGLVRVYDQGTDAEVSYLTMEYIDGPTLRQRMLKELTIPVGEALRITEQVLDAVGAAHRQGLVHRDVKPENILFDAEGAPRVADFGLARAVTEVTATTTGTVLGTVAYLAPEVASTGAADTRADVYAAGIMLYEMITGRPPYSGGTAIEVAQRHVDEDVPAPSSVVPWLPTEIDALVATLTARDPDQRPADANEAVGNVRRTRGMVDAPTLDRRADPPTGPIPVTPAASAEAGTETVKLGTPQAGSTIALPIGLGSAPGATKPTPKVPASATTSTGSLGIVEDDPEATEPQRTTTRLGWWIGAAVLAVAVLSSLGVLWYTTIGPGAYATVPPTAGNTAAQARAILETAEFQVDVVQSFSDDVPAGIVIETTPAEQSSAVRGSTVIVTVSKGKQRADVPQVVGVLEADALAELRRAGFPVGDVTRAYSDDAPEGEVISSTPEPGENVEYDTPVDLVVSDGPEPITIPDVYNTLEDAAMDLLEFYALDVTVEYGTSSEVAEGRVFKQDPAGRAAGFRTQEVTIWVSTGPPMVEVPFFVGNTVSLASDRAEDAGLEVNFVNSAFYTGNSVRAQDIEGGTMVPEGTVITLTY